MDYSKEAWDEVLRTEMTVGNAVSHFLRYVGSLSTAPGAPTAPIMGVTYVAFMFAAMRIIKAFPPLEREVADAALCRFLKAMEATQGLQVLTSLQDFLEDFMEHLERHIDASTEAARTAEDQIRIGLDALMKKDTRA